MAEESDNSDSWGNILKKSYQLFGIKINDQKDNQELKDALNDLDRITKMDSVPAKKAKQIVKVEHKIIDDLSSRRYKDRSKYQNISPAAINEFHVEQDQLIFKL